MISVVFDHVCSRLVAAYRWSIVGQQLFDDKYCERVQECKHHIG
jgi:hypothetical protein